MHIYNHILQIQENNTCGLSWSRYAVIANPFYTGVHGHWVTVTRGLENVQEMTSSLYTSLPPISNSDLGILHHYYMFLHT